MSARLLRFVSAVGAGALIGVALPQSPAGAGGSEGQYRSTNAKTSSGSIRILSKYLRWESGHLAGHLGGVWHGSAPPCVFFPAGPVGDKVLGKGGSGPGAWYIPLCKLPPHDYGNPMSAVWIAGPLPAPPTSPIVLEQHAVATLLLAGPQIRMSPPPNKPQIVNISTWLWITGAWRGRSATATAGPVAATATAVPYKVVWSMGDGHTVTCLGPGTPYNSNEPASAQSTSRSYTYTTPSSAAPGGRFTVTATVYYRVTWVARGAPGGGNLGLVAGPTSRTTVLVEQSEALNTAGG
jgi:hypothetical protein